MPDIYGPILPLQLDPRNTSALVRDTQTKIFLESDGSLNDFSPASPLSAIVEGQAYAQNELLYYLNSLPEAYTLQWLRQLGIQRSIGAKSVAEVSFIKTKGFTRAVVIPKGTILSTTSELKFVLKSQVIISDTQTSASGLVESERWGTRYNVPASAIEKANVNILGLDGVTNFTPAKGGKDLESIDNMKAKAFALLRRRGLISQEDYYNEVISLAPANSIVKVLTYEDRFNLTEEVPVGNIIICAGNENAEPLDNQIKSSILNSIRKKSPLGIAVSLTEPRVSPIEVSVSIEYNSEEFTSGVDFYASGINAILSTAFSPSEIDLGSTFDYQKVFNAIYDLNFVQSINSMTIKVLKLEEDSVGQYCNSPFVSELVNDVCINETEAIIDNFTSQYKNTDPIRTYRYCKNIVTLISSTTQSPTTYTFENQEYKSYLDNTIGE